jgi:TnpA family transposase
MTSAPLSSSRTRGTCATLAEVLAHQASCLNLVTNAVIGWNTVSMTAVVEQLQQEGYPV